MEILTFTTSGVETKFTSRGGVSRWSSLRPRLREVVMIRFELGCEPPRLESIRAWGIRGRRRCSETSRYIQDVHVLLAISCSFLG